MNVMRIFPQGESMTPLQQVKRAMGLLKGFRGITSVSKDGMTTRYAIGTRQHRRIVAVRTLCMMSFA